MGQVLVSDRAHGERSQVDLARAAEMQEQIEGSLEAADPKGEVAPGFGDAGVFAHGVRRTAALTSCIVACATLRARREPSCRISTDRKSTRLNSSHLGISYAVFCLKKKKKQKLYAATPHFKILTDSPIPPYRHELLRNY